MSDIAKLYINKVNRIYDNTSDLQMLAKDIAESFKQLSEFRKYIASNVEIINQFRNISDGICQFIDCEDIYKRDISLIFDQIKEVKDLISQIKVNISETKRIFPNKYQNELTEFEKRIEDCFDNMTFGTIGNYMADLENANKRLLKFFRERIAKYQGCISTSDSLTFGLKTDGTVVLVGETKPIKLNSRNYERYNINCSHWQNIVAISLEFGHVVGLKADGTVVADGRNDEGQCNTWSWSDIVAIYTTHFHTVGLKADGTVVAVGDNNNGQCNVGSWRSIVAIFANCGNTIGLKVDGTVVVVGYYVKKHIFDKWENIVAISASNNHTVGLKADGTVVAMGSDGNEQFDTKNWSDIVVADTNSFTIVGLKADGKVVAVGRNDEGQCNTESWRDIVAISASGYYTVGLKADGTVVAIGRNDKGQCNTKSWRDIVAISASDYHTVGLKADGTVVAVGENYDGQCNTQNWKDIGPVDKERMQKEASELKEEERRKEEQRRIEQQRKGQGLCHYCGGSFSGFFTKTCKSCGKAKDY